MTIYGCPSSDDRWEHGYLNISFIYETNLYENGLGLIGWNHAFLTVKGPYGPYSHQLNFCTRKTGTQEQVNSNWPPGLYSIYKVGETCPNGK